MPPRFLPLLFDVGDSFVLLVGGGDAAHSKLAALLPFQPRVRLVAPTIHPATEALARSFPVHEVHQREWKKSDLKDVALVYVFTNVEKINKQVAREAKKRGLPANVAGSRGQGGFLSPAAAKIGDWVLAVSSQGSNPRQAVRLRDHLASTLQTLIQNEQIHSAEDQASSQGDTPCTCP
jgi:siroheme synthase-like protein